MPTNYSIASVEDAQYLKLPMSTFVDYIRRGLIAYNVSGRDRLFTKNELKRFKLSLDREENKL